MQILVNNNNGEVRNVQQDSGIANEDANCTIINEYAPRSNFINKKLNTLPYSGLATVFLGYDSIKSVRQEICDSTQQVSDIENSLSDLFCSKSTQKIINLDNYNYVGTISKSSSYSIILDITSKVLIVGKNSYVGSFSGYYQYLKASKINPAASSYDYNNRYYKLENLTLCDENNIDKSKYIDTNNYFIQIKSDYTNSTTKQIALISGSNLKSIKSFFNFSFIFPFTTTDIEMTNWKFAYKLKDNGVRKIPIISSLHSDDDTYSDNLYFIDSNTMTVNELIESNENLKSDIEQLESQEHSEYQYYERRLIGSKSTEYFTNDQIITGKFYIYGFYPYDYQVNEGMESYKSGIERMVLTSELMYYTITMKTFNASGAASRGSSIKLNIGTTLSEISKRTAKNNDKDAISASTLSTILARLGIYSSYDDYHYAFEYLTDTDTVHDDQTEKIINDFNLDCIIDKCNTAIIYIYVKYSNTVIITGTYIYKDIRNEITVKDVLSSFTYHIGNKTYSSYVSALKAKLDSLNINIIFLDTYINKYDLQYSANYNNNYPATGAQVKYENAIKYDVLNKLTKEDDIIDADNRTAIYCIHNTFAKKVTAYVGTKDSPTATGFLVEGLTIRSCLLDATNVLSYNEGTPWSQDLLTALLPDFGSTILELSSITAKAYKSDGTYDEIADLDHVVSSDYSYYEISVLEEEKKTFNYYSSPNNVKSVDCDMDSDDISTSIQNGVLTSLINDIENNISDGYRSTGKYYAIGKTTGTQYEEDDCPTEDVILYAYTESYVEANGGSTISYGTSTWTPHESSITFTITNATSYNGNINGIIMDYIIDNAEKDSFKPTNATTVEHNYNTNSNNLDIQGFYTHGSIDRIIHFISATLTGIASDGTETDYSSKIRYSIGETKVNSTTNNTYVAWTESSEQPREYKIISDDYKYNTADYFCHDYTRSDYTDYNSGSFENRLKLLSLIGSTTFPVGYKFEFKVKYEIAATKSVIS